MTTDDRRRAIGKVVSVAADRLVVELHGGTSNFTVVGFDDVHYVARLGSFVVIPAQAEYVVAEVVGLREKDAPSSRNSAGDSIDMDKAASAKYLDLVPVGMLPHRRQHVASHTQISSTIDPHPVSDMNWSFNKKFAEVKN